MFWREGVLITLSHNCSILRRLSAPGLLLRPVRPHVLGEDGQVLGERADSLRHLGIPGKHPRAFDALTTAQGRGRGREFFPIFSDIVPFSPQSACPFCAVPLDGNPGYVKLIFACD